MITMRQYRAGMFSPGKFTIKCTDGVTREVAYGPHFSGGCWISVDGDFDAVHPGVYSRVLSHIGVK